MTSVCFGVGGTTLEQYADWFAQTWLGKDRDPGIAQDLICTHFQELLFGLSIQTIDFQLFYDFGSIRLPQIPLSNLILIFLLSQDPKLLLDHFILERDLTRSLYQLVPEQHSIPYFSSPNFKFFSFSYCFHGLEENCWEDTGMNIVNLFSSPRRVCCEILKMLE